MQLSSAIVDFHLFHDRPVDKNEPLWQVSIKYLILRRHHERGLRIFIVTRGIGLKDSPIYTFTLGLVILTENFWSVFIVISLKHNTWLSFQNGNRTETYGSPWWWIKYKKIIQIVLIFCCCLQMQIHDHFHERIKRGRDAQTLIFPKVYYLCSTLI